MANNNLIDGGIYFVKDSYFEKYNDPEFVDNKEGGRPYFFALKAKHIGDFYLFIPASSQVEKYRNIIDTRAAARKPTDYIHITSIGNKESALLLNKMIPITNKYIERPYEYHGVPFRIVENDNNHELYTKVNKVLKLARNNVPLPYQTNLMELIDQIEREPHGEQENKV